MAVHIVSATQVDTPDGRHALAMCGEGLGPYVEASAAHPVGNYLSATSPRLRQVTCESCRRAVGA